MPSVSLALVLELGSCREVMPVYSHDLLVDAAVIALRDAVSDARSETNAAAAAVKAEEAIILSRVLRRLIPEIRELLEPSTPAPEEQVLVQ